MIDTDKIKEQIAQMKQHVASYKTLSRHRQACLDLCESAKTLLNEREQLIAALKEIESGSGEDDDVKAKHYSQLRCIAKQALKLTE